MSKGTEFSETPKVPEIQESLKISEARQDLDRATHDPESSADKVGDFKKAENLESEFITAMDNALDPTEPPEDTATSSGEVTDSQETAGKTADQAELDAAQDQINQEIWEAEMEVTTQEEQNAAEYIQGLMDMIREINDLRQSMVSEGEEEPTASEVSNGTEISESEEEPTASNAATESAEEEEEEEQELAASQEGDTDAFPQGDVMESLMGVFQESIETTNSDMDYMFNKLADMNEISEAMADYMEEMNDLFFSGQHNQINFVAIASGDIQIAEKELSASHPDVSPSEGMPSLEDMDAPAKSTPETEVIPLDPSNTPALEQEWTEIAGDLNARGVPTDINALVQSVLRESYLETNQDLVYYAEKVKFYNECKKQVRDYLSDLRNYKTQLETDEEITIPVTTTQVAEDGSQVELEQNLTLSQEDFESLVEILESEDESADMQESSDALEEIFLEEGTLVVEPISREDMLAGFMKLQLTDPESGEISENVGLQAGENNQDLVKLKSYLGELADLLSHLAELQVKALDIKSAIKSEQESLSTLQEELGESNVNIKNINKSIQVSEAKIGQLQEQLETVNNEMQQTQTQIKEVQMKISKLLGK